MQLTVRQAARLLAVPEKTIYRWLEDGTLPCRRVNEQYRFNRGELLEWATARGLPVSVAHFQAPDDADAIVSLVAALETGGIRRGVGGCDRESVLRAVVEAMPLPDQAERDLLLSLLVAREAMGTTAVGGGIAIPHVRNPIVLHVPRPAVTLCFLKAGVDFAALDGRPVHTLFTLVTPTIRTHLNLLARLSAALHDAGFRAAVEARADDHRILAEASRVEASFDSGARSGPAPQAAASRD